MKKFFAILIFILSLCMCVSADDNKNSYNGFCGLFEIISKTQITDFNAAVPTDDANKIINSFFKEKPFKNENITNADLMTYLFKKCDKKISAPPLKFHDAGLLSKELREVYSVLNGNGKVYSGDGFLNPENILTYDYLTGSLSLFENEILENLSYTRVKGSIISVSLEKGTTTIRLNTENGITDVKFKNMENVLVFKDGIYAPYSRNLERNDIIETYTDLKNNGIYVKVTGESFDDYKKYKDTHKLYKGYVYYIDHETAIIKDIYEFDGNKYIDYSPDTYLEFTFDENTTFKFNFKETYIDYVNEYLLDKPIYIICDNNRQKAQYFNIAEW